MGITQHRNSVDMIQEIVNVLLLRGNIGRPGAGVFPVRGHSNVQGDRTMGIWERMPDPFLVALGDEFRFDPPRAMVCDAVGSIQAMAEGRAKVLVAMGGNPRRPCPTSASPRTPSAASASRLAWRPS